MKKIIAILLLLSVILCTSSCTTNVNNLIEKGKYEEALVIMEKNPEKYTDLYDETRYKLAEECFSNDLEKTIALLQENHYEQAPTLLNDAYNLKFAIEIETHLNEMKSEIEAHNPDKWTPNFDYMDEADYYLKINDKLNEAYDIIVRDNNLDNALEIFIEIFGYMPDSTTQAKDAIKNLLDDLGFEKFYDSPFFYYQALDYVMGTLTKNSEFVRFELTDTSGFMVVEQPYQFLQTKKISAKTFANLLGVCINMGAEIKRDSEKIIVTFKNIQSDTYYSRGYFYCAPNSQHAEISKFKDKVNISIKRWGIDEVGVWMDVILTNPDGFDLKYLSMNSILITVDGKHIETASKLLKNVNDKEITFTLDFKDVTMEELKEKDCSIELFGAVVLNK